MLDQSAVIVSLTSSIHGNSALYRLSVIRREVRANIATINNATLQTAHGIDTDKEDNVYVCCSGLSGVLQISAKHGNIRELIGETSGVKDPRDVSVIQDKLVVADVAKSNANIIRIFRLQ